LIGVLGGGQLARMLALAGYPLGERFAAIDPSPECGVRDLAHLIVAGYDDPAALDWMAEHCDVVTYEFERVPAASARRIAERALVHPNPGVLDVAQDRLTEKELFTRLGLATPAFAAASTRAELEAAVASVGMPVLVKTRREGYDGKGQFVIRSAGELDRCWNELGGTSDRLDDRGNRKDLIVEELVDFDRELSVLAVRSIAGETAVYPVVENEHSEGILRVSRAPGPGLAPELQAAVESHARSIMDELDYVGVLAVELFQVGDRLLGNEMAPRVHNSGHWTIEGAVTSQFANHLRAITGRPLGSIAALGHSAMVNLIGALPDLDEVLRIEGAHLHLYDKQPRPGRKLGHVTLVAEDPEELEDRLGRVVALVDEPSQNRKPGI
jgi:5-(carboxyamino)imidazole ribonucleotide synthase